MKYFLNILLLLAILTPTALATGCSAGAAQSADMGHAMAPLASLPQGMQSAPTTVREAYQFAVANPDALIGVPCYCGCKAVGHTSNYSCFVKQVKDDGTVIYDNHALGCSLCIDIAQDVMKMTQQGKSPGQIHAEIVAQFSRFGPPNQ